MTVSVVVVNHDSGDGLDRFLASLATEDPTEVVVVDNASSDGSAEDLKTDLDLRILFTGANLGYGRGANRGIATTQAELVLVSNPDVILRPGALAPLAEALRSDPTLAIAGPTILNADGSRYPSARRFPPPVLAVLHALLGTVAPDNPFSRRYRMEDVHDGAPSPCGSEAVDWVSGACFMARRKALEELGGFDESYFMYLEDLDLCWRAHRAGWGVAYVPASVVTHHQGLSTARKPYRMLLAHHRSAFRFAVHTTTGWRRAALPGVALVLGVRLVLTVTRQLLAHPHQGNRHKNAAPGD
jgi:N-acetylglucosaminyl-diphospho-decaprenol L-rhamnosyltransferase